MQKTFPLSKVRPNPFRDMNTYPIDEAKVETLIASFEKTGYWGNIVGRENGIGVNIAYGHHRLEAMNRSMKETDEVEIITKDLSDADMIRIMADENMEEWSSNARIEQETIRAVVTAYADGNITEEDIEKPHKDAKKSVVRYAPNFAMGQAHPVGLHPYTADTVARFLGWTTTRDNEERANHRVFNALNALEEAEVLGAEQEYNDISEGLSSKQNAEIVSGMKRVKKSWTPKKPDPSLTDADKKKIEATANEKSMAAGKAGSDALRNNEGMKNAKKEIVKYLRPIDNQKQMPDIETFSKSCVIGPINQIFREHKESETKLTIHERELREWKEYVNEQQQKKVVQALEALSNRCLKLATKWQTRNVGSKVHLLEER